MIKVTLSDGRSLTSTLYHKWYLQKNYNGEPFETTTQDLKIGDKIIKYTFPILKGGKSVDKKQAYTQGFISGDGSDGYNSLFLYEPKYVCLDRLDVKNVSKEYVSKKGVKRKRL